MNPSSPPSEKAAPASGAPVSDTRSRILKAAQQLFRKRGYHGTGLNDILELAQAPKGSMYHHFPGGKEQIGVCVINNLTDGLIALFMQSDVRSAHAMLLQVGEQLVVVAEKTNFEICALYSSFVAERAASPQLSEAVSAGYGRMIDTLAQRLVQDGIPARLAMEKAQIAVALLEGGSLLAQARLDAALFRAAVKQAAALCRIDR